MSMIELQAKAAVESAGYQVRSITLIPGGYSHNNFAVGFREGLPAIARFDNPSRFISPDGVRREPHFNGLLSLTRERNLINMVREKTGLPVPQVYGLHSSAQGPFLLVERLPGSHWNEYLKASDYSFGAYLRSLRFLGNDLARVHAIEFNSFGDLLGEDCIDPANITNFAERLGMITQLKIQRAEGVGVLDTQELADTKGYFNAELTTLDTALRDSTERPVLVLADLHPTNVLVDDQGKPSGYFDLEWCQAGSRALEFYVLRWSFFHYFDGVSQPAEEEFLAGYQEKGGTYDPQNPLNKSLEQVLAVNHLLAAVTAYHNVSDGLRDTWSQQFKKIMFDAMRVGSVDYAAINDVLRSKTNQPRFPRFY